MGYEYNKEQEEIVNTIDGRIQVIAAAGSGKTATLIGRIANMVEQGIKEEDILAISFTNASATDLKKKLKEKDITRVESGTFHNICKQLLMEKGYDNLFNFPNKYEIKRELETKTMQKDINIDDVMSWIGYQQAYNIDSSGETKHYDSLYSDNELKRFYNIYEKYKKRTNSVDFGDWLILAHKEYKDGKITKKWKYVCVDECQDLNTIQHLLATDLCSTNNIFMVGDLRQSIFQFNGGVPELFENYDKEHKDTKVINLYTNYRSCNNIVKAANNFIRPYFSDYEHYKDAEAFNKEDGIIECHYYITKEAEAVKTVDKIKELIEKGEKPEEIAVLYRNNSTSDYIENELKKREIEYTCTSNNSFYDRVEIKGIIATLRLIMDITDDEAFEILLRSRFYPCTYFKGNLIDQLKTDSGKKNISLYEAFEQHKFYQSWERRNANELINCLNNFRVQKDKKVGLTKLIDNIIRAFKIMSWIKSKYEIGIAKEKIDSMQNLKAIANGYTLENYITFVMNGGSVKNKREKGVLLSTIHKSKGLEYNVTFIIGLEDGNFPSEKADLKSEARLMYVAVTRAKKEIYLSSIESSQFYQEYKKGENNV